MSFSRTSSTGRRFTATPRLREEPDMKTLVALVLHLADRLHADEQAQQRTRTARDDHNGLRINRIDWVEERNDDDTLTASTRD